MDAVAPLASSFGRDVPAGRTGVDTGPVGEFVMPACPSGGNSVR